MLTKDDFKAVYALLDKVTPLEKDCGILCNKICCSEWDKDVGVYLLPGEECMFSMDEDWLVWETHSPKDYEFAPSWTQDVYFIKCTKPCPRNKRPFACRTFPLTAYLTEDGTLKLIFDPNSIPICPLTQVGNLDILQPRFIQNVRKAWRLLLKDPLVYDDVFWQSRVLDKVRSNPHAALLTQAKRKL